MVHHILWLLQSNASPSASEDFAAWSVSLQRWISDGWVMQTILPWTADAKLQLYAAVVKHASFNLANNWQNKSCSTNCDQCMASVVQLACREWVHACLCCQLWDCIDVYKVALFLSGQLAGATCALQVAHVIWFLNTKATHDNVPWLVKTLFELLKNPVITPRNHTHVYAFTTWNLHQISWGNCIA